MDNLKSIENKRTIDSREIAEMMGTTHAKIIRKLEGDKERKGIITILAEAQMGVGDYFIKSAYKDANNQERPCYLCTKMGCEFLANKFTGEKGILFTAKYVKRFNEMEQNAVPKNYLEALKQLVVSEEHKQKLELKNKQQQQIIGELKPKAETILIKILVGISQKIVSIFSKGVIEYG